MKYIAIDPGITGAIADSEGRVFDLPTMQLGKDTVVKQAIDPVGLWRLLHEQFNALTDPTQVTYIIERQMYRKKFKPKAAGGGEIPQGGSSIFSLGDTYGCVRSICLLTGSRCIFVMPNAWKKIMKLNTDKEYCRSRAIELFPSTDIHRKKDHNRAEALLLAYYGEHYESSK